MKFGKQPVKVLANSEWIDIGLNVSLFNETKPNKAAIMNKLSPIILVLLFNFVFGICVSLLPVNHASFARASPNVYLFYLTLPAWR